MGGLWRVFNSKSMRVTAAARAGARAMWLPHATMIRDAPAPWIRIAESQVRVAHGSSGDFHRVVRRRGPGGETIHHAQRFVPHPRTESDHAADGRVIGSGIGSRGIEHHP